jgi:hypothetical protein
MCDLTHDLFLGQWRKKPRALWIFLGDFVKKVDKVVVAPAASA